MTQLSLLSRAIQLVFALTLSLFLANAVFAQDKDSSTVQKLTAQLTDIENSLKREGLSEQQLTQLRERLTKIRADATAEQDRLTPLLQDARARFDALKPAEKKEGDSAAPEENADKTAEIDALEKQRTAISTQLASIQSEIKLVKAAIVRADQLNNRITIAREERFASQLFERSGTLLNPKLWVEGLSGIATTWRTGSLLISDWFAFLSQKAGDKIWQVSGMILFVALLIIGPLRYLLFSGLTRLARLESPTPLQKSLHAVWSIFTYTLVPFAIILGAGIVLKNANLMPSRIESLTQVIASLVFIVALSYGLIRALLAPQKPAYRLLSLDNTVATKLFGIAIILLIAYTVEAATDELTEVLFAPLETTILLRGATSILIAVMIWMALRVVIASQLAQTETTSPTMGASSFTLPRFFYLLRPLVWLSCLVIIAAPILGYVSLGAFLAEQLGRIFIVLGLLGILTALIDNFLLESLEGDSDKSIAIGRAVGIQPKTIHQIGVLFNGMLRILLYVSAALLIFAPWGVQSTDFLTSLQNAIFSIQIGDLNISPINILGAILVFIIALVLVKGIQTWMDRRLLPATNLDTGLKNSIHTSVGYVGFILAAMLAFSYMGIDLSNLALVAGALSVGIGFGLQSIVNNFVSGLILLVERPIKTGDWVVVGEDQGYVQKISVRATKIETFDRATVIVPNSDLISNRVLNWMHSGSMGRIIIPVGVSYDADPEQVKDILLKIAEESEHISSYPEPRVYFMDFGASSLDFQLRCYIQNIDSSLTAKSALRFAIFKALKEASIEIPFPQQDIHVRSITKSDDEIEIVDPKQLRKKAKSPSKQEMKADEVDLDGDGDGSY